MKTEERKEARRLRQEMGLSVREIAKAVGVSKGTVSVWVRDISLNNEQKNVLLERNPAYNRQWSGSEGCRTKWETKRKEWRDIGMKEADRGNWLHVAGCMLYWAEGTKRNNRNMVAFTNSDAGMMKLFIMFLRQCFIIQNDDISVAVNCYTDIRSVEECENHWLEILGLDRSNLRKTISDRRPACTKQKRNGLLEYGTCKLMVHKTEILQRIYGALIEYAGFSVFD